MVDLATMSAIALQNGSLQQELDLLTIPLQRKAKTSKRDRFDQC